MNEIDWLLGGDPAIRWQVLRDLCAADEPTYRCERKKIASQGWGARLLSYQDDSGLWGGQLYNHKWLSTTYTMLLLRGFGLEQDNAQAQKACHVLLSGGYQNGGRISFARDPERIDLGVTGMVLSILAYFGSGDNRIHAIAETLVRQQMPDGRWEPWPGNEQLKYTFDSTLLVLEGLHEYEKQYPQQAGTASAAQQRGREFLLKHRLFMTGPADEKLIHASMLLFSFPPRWHYDVLEALDYFHDCRVEKDERLSAAIGVLLKRRNSAGSWNLQNRHAGKTYFEMETVGMPSRWNTLRALRVLSWWQSSD